jgi:hypothetical protein
MKVKDSLPKYIINFDEFVQLLGEDLCDIITEAIKNSYPHITTNNLEALLETIKSILPSEKYKDIVHNIDLIVNNSTIDGVQKVKGIMLDVPPIKQSIEKVFQFDKDVYITGLHFNQTGWKNNDTYDLEASKKRIIDNAMTKEIGEHKYFNTYLSVNANTPIKFTLNNKSGNSRQTMIDLEYIEKRTPPTPPDNPPDTPEEQKDSSWLDTIKHDFDIAVIMNWESNTAADIDLYGFMDGISPVGYNNLGDDTFKLDFDWTSHLTNTNPEIITVKGHKDKSLKIYIHNFRPTLLTQPVSVRVYSKGLYKYKLLKEYNVDLLNDRSYILGVCSIDLNTLIISDLNDRKPY